MSTSSAGVEMAANQQPLKPPSPPVAPRSANAQGEIEALEEFVMEVEDARETLRLSRYVCMYVCMYVCRSALIN
jgi:hypothetical protein